MPTDMSAANNLGKKLLDLCKSSRLLIMNGRLGTDKRVGHFTRVDTTGNSVVDYGIITPQLFGLVAGFSKDDKVPESDHLPMSISIKCHLPLEENCSKDISGKWTPYVKYKWSHTSMHGFKCALLDYQSQVYYQCVLDQMVSMNSCNDLAESLNEYIKQAADRTFDKIKRRNS